MVAVFDLLTNVVPLDQDVALDLDGELGGEEGLELDVAADVHVVSDQGVGGASFYDALADLQDLLQVAEGDFVLFHEDLQQDDKLGVCIFLEGLDALHFLEGVLVDDLSDLTNLVLLREAAGAGLLKLFNCFGDLFLTAIVGLAELQVGSIVLGDVLPTLLVAGIAHADLFFVFAQVFALEEELRASEW